MTDEEILQRRMHGLYLSRRCEDPLTLAHHLMGLHCWFHRNVLFSLLIRGANPIGWKTSLTKTWIHHALHGVAPEDLPDLLAVRPRTDPLSELEREVISYMEDGVYSRAEFRRIFADRYEQSAIDRAFSPWGGVFVGLAQRGLVAFRDMNSRDFDLISAEPTRSKDEVMPELLRRYFIAYGPATIADAAWFFGLRKDDAKRLCTVPLDDLHCFEHNKSIYYYHSDSPENRSGMADIPEVTLLSGFDPFVVSYIDRSAVMPPEYKSRVVMKSGICLPTVAINGRIAGLWNIKKNAPVLELFAPQPRRIEDAAYAMVESIYRRTKLYL